MIHSSVNEVICHGIPDMRPLKDGDLLNSKFVFCFNIKRQKNHGEIHSKMFTLGNMVFKTLARHVIFFFVTLVDITIYYNGFHGDLNETYFVGDVDEDSKQLVKVTYECINQAIAAGIPVCVYCINTSKSGYCSRYSSLCSLY